LPPRQKQIDNQHKSKNNYLVCVPPAQTRQLRPVWS
jgi:hypothetical protein